jgi:hypothetical protein
MKVIAPQADIILQGKIDKIGEFRFTIKGWALTLNTGTVVAAFATSLDAGTAILLVFGLLFALWLLELRQIRLSNTFQDRALRIEKVIGRRLQAHGLSRSDFVSVMRIPGIAHELRNPFDARRPDKALANKRVDARVRRSCYGFVAVLGARNPLAFRRA